MVAEVIKRVEKASEATIAHYDLRFLKPIDKELLHEVGRNFKHVVTIEDGVQTGGMGSAVLEFMNEQGYQPAITRLGVPDRFIEHGSVKELYHICGLDEDSLAATFKKIMNQ